MIFDDGYIVHVLVVELYFQFFVSPKTLHACAKHVQPYFFLSLGQQKVFYFVQEILCEPNRSDQIKS